MAVSKTIAAAYVRARNRHRISYLRATPPKPPQTHTRTCRGTKSPVSPVACVSNGIDWE
ncbi:hypothetical protein E4U24_005723 [Claviceps purpurea]|nr:hypothetical protein E4U36_003189 [Claviceps purpurea]KAG6242440.1 hypothetical protein E4U24_005723 [Claviceps purpurea]